MRIRTQFIITVLLFGIVLVVIAASAVITNRQVEKARRQENIADHIVREASALGYLYNDYLVYHENQQLKRWQSMFASFSVHVADLHFESPEQQAFVRNIQANQNRMKEVFEGIRPIVESLPGNQTSVPGPASFQVSWSRMAIQSQGLVSDASRLSKSVHDQMDRLLEIRTMLIYVMVALVGALFLVGYALTYRRILNSITALRAGAATIGSGDLDFVIEEKKDDEIGELSRAFNRMVTDLKTVTASKSDMEREILERKRLEEALHKSHEQLEHRVRERTAELRRSEETAHRRLAEIESYYDTAPVGLAVFDTNLRYMRINERLAGLNGVPAADHIGRTPRQVVPSLADEMERLARQVFESGEPLKNVEFRGETPTSPGIQRTWLEGWYPVKNAAGQVQWITVVGQEITEQRQLEQQLRQAQKMEALGTLSGGIAHDFNNILAAIIGFTELLSDRVPKGSRDERYLRRVMEASLRGRTLVKQMLMFSRKTEQERMPLKLSDIVRETATLVRATTPTTISIRVNTACESQPILGDPTQIQQVLMNLCTNAAHAMQANGGVLDIGLDDFSVSASERSDGMAPGRYTKLTVSDTGTGIPPDIIDRIFDPFFTTKKLGEGTGLGLSVAHGIVKQSNGYITVASEPGKATVFSVYFPQIAGVAQADPVSDNDFPMGDERILFVDDEELLTEMGEELLAQLGYNVTCRTSSMGALSLLKEDPSRFDLVITDQTMPDMTGIELVGEILAFRADMPIIMCTGFSHLVDAETANAAGIKAFALKPLTKREIARTIRKVLGE